MGAFAETIQHIKTWINKPGRHWLLAAAFFLLVSWFYMGSALTHCSTVTTAINSDSTGGIVWFQWVSGNHLSWNFSSKSNFPAGESLQRPQFVTSEALFFPYRVASSFTTPICGLNLLVLAGYMSCALLMYGLVRWLFKRLGIAYFAGYAAAYVPYHQLKAQSHVVYMFGGIFIALVWAYLWYIERPSYRRITLFAILAALGMYMDGYFVLLTAFLVAALVGVSMLRGVIRLFSKKGNISISIHPLQIIKNIFKHFRHLVCLGLILTVLLLPILNTQKNHGADIQQALSASRGNIQSEAKSYGARPAEFLLPSYNNRFVPASYQNWRIAHQHGSNPSEDTLYIGITVFVLGCIAVIYLFNKPTRELRLKENISYLYLILLIVLVLGVCALMSLSPYVTLFHQKIPTPVALLIKVTANWRVLSRFFLVIDPLAITLAASGLYVITRKWSKPKYLILLSACFIILFGEYYSSPIRPTKDLYKDSPAVFRTIAKDPSINTVAEYPLLELLYVPTIFAFQPVYNKNVINADESSLEKKPLNQSISGINDIQTLGILKAEGVNLIITYGIDLSSSKNLIPYAPPDTSIGLGLPQIFTYRISDSVVVDNSALIADKNFDDSIIDGVQVSHHVLRGNGTMSISQIPSGSSKNTLYQASFDIQTPTPLNTLVTIKQGNNVLWSGNVMPDPIHVNFLASSTSQIDIITSSPIVISSMLATPQNP
jgi:hypothetical protein